MSWLLLLSIIIVVLIVVAAVYTYTYGGKGHISADRAKMLLATGQIRSVVDVRTGWEWNRGHYPTAVHVPASEITKEKIVDLMANQVLKEPILLYCNTGQRARRAADAMRDVGVEEVYYISGHWEGLM